MFSLFKYVVTISAIFAATTAHAGGYVRTYAHGYQRFVYPQAITVYMVGAQIRSAAEVEALKRADPIYQLGLQALQQQQAADVPADALAQEASQLTASCTRCHGGEKVEGGLDLTGHITPEQLKAIKARMAAGEMPPKTAPEAKDFSNEQAGSVLLEAIERLGATE